MTLVFFSSAFCDPCHATRSVLAEVAELVPTVCIVEWDVARQAAEAERAGIRSTPTVIVLDRADREVFRAEGVPTRDQVLTAMARAL